MNPVILLVEDEPAIADTLAWTLKNEGFSPCHVSTGGEALKRIEQGGIAVVVLDVGLPDLSGFEVCRRIRAKDAGLPVMFLTARSEEIDRVLGFEIGADDYVAKPFSPREVAARLRVMLRRSGVLAVPSTQAVPILALDEAAAQVRAGSSALPLTRFEYLLLRHLMRHPSHVFSREQLLDAVWGLDSDSTDRTVDTHIKTLRAKLRAVSAELDPIQTHRGLGYSFAP